MRPTHIKQLGLLLIPLLWAISATSLETHAKCNEQLVRQHTIAHPAIKDQTYFRLPLSVRHSIEHEGPFQQRLAAIYNDKNEFAFGTENSIYHARQGVLDLKPILYRSFGIENESPIRITANTSIVLAPAISGSSTRNSFHNDIDSEAILIVQSQDFRADDFENPKSQTIQTLKSYFQNYLINMSKKIDFTFSEMKIGEDSNTGLALKWTQQEVLDGKKDGITLDEALSQEARIKIDWIVEVPTHPEVFEKTGVKTKLTELSIVYFLGGQKGNNSPVLKTAKENHLPHLGSTGGHLALKHKVQAMPLRGTTLFFSETHLNTARIASITAPAPNLQNLNINTLASLATLENKGDRLKVYKRLYGRLHYWNDADYFEKTTTQKSSYETLLGQVTAITRDQEILFLEQLKSTLETFVLYQQKTGSTHPLEKETLNGFISLFPMTAPNSKSLLMHIKQKIGNKLDQLEEKFSLAKEYKQFVMSQDYAKKFITDLHNNVFVTFKLSDKTLKAYEEWCKNLKEKYPQIHFVSPNDFHMTFAYLGDLDQSAFSEIQKNILETNQKLSNNPIVLDHPSIQIVSKTGRIAALVYSERDKNTDTLEIIQDFKMNAQKHGIKPDEYFKGFLPHLSFIDMRATAREPDGNYQLTQLFSKEEIPKELQELILNQGTEIMARTQEENKDPSDKTQFKKISDTMNFFESEDF